MLDQHEEPPGLDLVELIAFTSEAEFLPVDPLLPRHHILIVENLLSSLFMLSLVLVAADVVIVSVRRPAPALTAALVRVTHVRIGEAERPPGHRVRWRGPGAPHMYDTPPPGSLRAAGTTSCEQEVGRGGAEAAWNISASSPPPPPCLSRWASNAG